MRDAEVTLLSVGGGQDSTALIYKAAFDQDFRARYVKGRLVAAMSATGNEHPETDAHVEDLKRFCAEHGIEFVHITPDMGFHSGPWRTLLHQWARNNSVGSKLFKKTCTLNLKVGPIYAWLEHWLHVNYGVEKGRKLHGRYLPGQKHRGIYRFVQEHGKINVIIGIAAGEEKRMATGEEPDTEPVIRDCVTRIYPLVDLGMDRAACQEYIKSVGKPVPLPSNCMFCPFMSHIELLWLWMHYPERFEEWCGYEERKIAKYEALGYPPEKNNGVWKKGTLRENLEIAKQKYGHMTKAQIWDYKMSHGHCVGSKY